MRVLGVLVSCALLVCAEDKSTGRGLSDYVEDYYHRFSNFFNLGRKAASVPDERRTNEVDVKWSAAAGRYGDEAEAKHRRPVQKVQVKRPLSVVVYRPPVKKVIVPGVKAGAGKKVHLYSDRIVVYRPMNNSSQKRVTVRFYKRLPAGQLRPMRLVPVMKKQRKEGGREFTGELAEERSPGRQVSGGRAARGTQFYSAPNYGGSKPRTKSSYTHLR